MADLQAMGEFGLIELITRTLERGRRLDVGIGDDCAVLRMGGEQVLLSCDAMVEGVHFRRDWATPEDIGYKAAAAALSDIAAMGGMPLCMLITLACPPDTSPAFLEALYTGINLLARHERVCIAGGDTTASPHGLMIDVVVVGMVTTHRPLCRSGVCPGDIIAVTGFPGCSRLGLEALRSAEEAPASLINAHLRPRPKLLEGRCLADYVEVHAMIDVSDGLAQDLGHLAQASGVAINVETERLPLAPDLVRFAHKKGLAPANCVLYGGEDYELAFAIASDGAASVLEEVRRHLVLPVTIIGAASAGAPKVTVNGEPTTQPGYNHFCSPK